MKIPEELKGKIGEIAEIIKGDKRKGWAILGGLVLAFLLLSEN